MANDNQPAQHQDQQPGRTAPMNPAPEDCARHYQGSGKLAGKVALITGGDSGIGRSIAVHYAKEGADVVVAYLEENEDAATTRRQVENCGRRCVTLAGDIGDEGYCRKLVDTVIDDFGQLDIVVNNAAEQHPQDQLEDISRAQLERTFRTNLFAMFSLTQAALPHLKDGASIINTTSITAYRGSPGLLDYSATKGAIVAFTRSLSLNLAARGIRVNAVAPGPVWTPLIPSTFPPDKVASFGSNVPMGRAGQPDEIAPAFVFLASRDASYISGQVIHPNGGVVVNA